MPVDRDDAERDTDERDLSEFEKETPPDSIEPKEFVDDVRDVRSLRRVR
jgi:hypothetical protein